MAEEDDDLGLCPGLFLHPAAPVPGRIDLLWFTSPPGHGQVVAYSCLCQSTCFELLAYSRLYRIRRTTLPRLGVPTVSFTGGWRRPEAYDWWHRLLTGHAR
ncbi:hypothetical protein [Sphaerimonospora thailandensis]|uniref:Uncharacterized protein n=1 Tax=Sphaerimonospora thailandensis TaxID=795644 RepID=A0A8J3R8K9_9ACTN|nr:hypothetical protein [Sphaerimonospora thailandensis]GIH69756.1 hypothetical protein Mth01_20090 [Sphaerimonospora thailandensis]